MMNHTLFSLGLLLAVLSGPCIAAEVPGDQHFKVDTLATGLVDAMELAVLPTGDVFIAERTGALKWYAPATGEVKVVKQFEVSVKDGNKSRETGLLGITADPNFMKNGWIYVYYSPITPEEHRLSRFTFKAGALKDEKILLSVEQSRKDGVCHEGGSLAFGRKGHLFLSLGDNTNPFDSNGFAPIDETEGNEHRNAQRTASNTKDLRGKIIRIQPTPDGGYSIPAGNLFPKGMPQTRPEIFVMGCRNPWRIGVDQRTGYLYWGEVGPDSQEETERGPKGHDEINQAKTAGNYGWPYFVADNKPYAAYDFAEKTVGEKFDPASPENRSHLNKGIKKLPAARAPLWFGPRSCYCAGPVYYYDDYPDSPNKLPREIDGCLITFDWNNGRMQLTKLDKKSDMAWKEDWLNHKKFVHPSDVAMGPDGAMYVLEYGSVWYDGTDGKLKKVTYSAEPIDEAKEKTLDPRLAGLPEEHPGTHLLAESNCISCHQTQVKSIGPRYVDVADRYRGKSDAVEMLIQKILKGGGGVWGQIPMPPNPQYNEEQVSQMVESLLSLQPAGHKE